MRSIDIIQAPDGKYTALPSARMFVETGVRDMSSKPAATPNPLNLDNMRWARWDLDDLFPANVRSLIEAVPMAGRAVLRRQELLYGNGLAYYRRSELYNTDGRVVPRASIRKVDDFLLRNRISTHWYAPQCFDYITTANAFSELIFSRDRSQITGIYHKGAEFCRRTPQAPETLLSEYLLYSTKFGQYTPNDHEILRFPVHQWYDEDDFLARLMGHKMAWHSYLDSPGTLYYGRPLWAGLFRQDGWLEVARSVPNIVSSMMHNQITLKYQINIPEAYFEMTHPDWMNYSAEKRDEAFTALINRINKTLTGTDNAFKSISFIFRQDPISGKEMGKVEIVAIDDKTKKDDWVPSSDAANSQIAYGFGVHPSQLGLGPEGGKLGAGSGSDMREGYNIAITTNTFEQDLLLEPLNWLARYNAQKDPDWDIVFFIDHTWHTTTNQREDGLQPSDTTLIVEPAKTTN